jgi:predicted nucleotidyltransferase
MQEDVRQQLLAIAEDFVDFMGIDTIKVADIRLYGSSAAYTYTKHSDIDLHVLVDMSDIEDDEVYSELFNSKKRLYNDNLDITVRGLPVELYMQDAKEEVKSLGDYSILNGRWVKFPKRAKASLEEHSVKEKFKRLIVLSELALRSDDIDLLDNLLDIIRRYRQAGLEEGGEFSPENLSWKALRSKGIVDKLYKHRDVLKSRQLSIDEQIAEAEKQKMVRLTVDSPRRR